jgi:hypothetical protein
MLQIFSDNPWLLAVAAIAFVPLVGIVVISFNVCRRKIRLAQFDFELKRDMLQRGMSANDIRTVIEAGRPTVSNQNHEKQTDQLREEQNLAAQMT